MSRLVVVSNRVTVATDTEAKAGGLAVALQDALKQHGGVWFGWSGKAVQKPNPDPTILSVGPVTYATVDLNRRQYAEYYNGYANRALWPLFHYRLGLTTFTKRDYVGYQEVNTMFAGKLLPLLKSDDKIWVHDYHLIPLGEELRKLGIERPMGFFLHTPFPAMEILTALPQHSEIVRALCAYDLVGFHTDRDLRAFLDYIVHEAGGGIMSDHLIHAYGRTLRVEIFPIGIDTEEFEKAGRMSATTDIAKHLRESLGDRAWIIGVDRLDYSKGLIERFRAFECLLKNYPEFRGNATLLQIAPPSRSEVPEYKEIRHLLEAEAGHINGNYAEFDWIPINYLSRSYSREDLAGLYRASKIGLVTSLRDGMNLVAKEYVAAQNPQDPGVLVLSRFAGASRELDSALIINPYDPDGVADAIAQGLTMSLEERRERWKAMMDVLKTNSLTKWRDDFIEALSNAPFE